MTEKFAMGWVFSLLGLMAIVFIVDMTFGPIVWTHGPSVTVVLILSAIYGIVMVGPPLLL